MTDAPDGTAVGAQDSIGHDAESSITLRHVLAAMGGGMAGTVLMAPLLVGVPMLFDVFRAEPLLDFAVGGLFFGIEPAPSRRAPLRFRWHGPAPVSVSRRGCVSAPRSAEVWSGCDLCDALLCGFLVAFWPGGGADQDAVRTRLLGRSLSLRRGTGRHSRESDGDTATRRVTAHGPPNWGLIPPTAPCLSGAAGPAGGRRRRIRWRVSRTRRR